MDSVKLAERCLEICEDRKAEDIRLYDVRESSLLADFYVICTGKSIPHIRAINQNLNKGLSQEGLKPRAVDGAAGSHWMVMDYGTVIVHIFHPELREFYNIEALWKDGNPQPFTPPDAVEVGAGENHA